MKKLLLLLLLGMLFTGCKTVERGSQISELPKYILLIEHKQFRDKVQFSIGVAEDCIESARGTTSTGNVYFEGDNY